MPVTRIQGEVEREQGIYYEVDSNSAPLGEGGMGKVYSGVQIEEETGIRRNVAVKFLYEDLDEQTLMHARREASIQLHNDNLLEMYGFSETLEHNVLGEPVRHYHIASELLEGITLDNVFSEIPNDLHGSKLKLLQGLKIDISSNPEVFAVRIIRNVLSGLMALHDAGYIHRDIDPSNIMLTTNNKIKIIDFGIAKKINDLGSHDRALTISGVFLGKPEYAAPELVLGDIKHQNATTDIYAVGILLYQCLQGHVPFSGPHHEVLQMQLHKKMPSTDIKNKKLREIVKKATNKKQNNRYQSVAEFRAALDMMAMPDEPSPVSLKITTKLLIAISAISGLATGVILGLL